MDILASPRTTGIRARRLTRSLLAVLLAAGLLSPLAARAHPPGVTERVSVASDGAEANDASGFLSPAAISADGRYVAFDSTATNLLPGGNLPFSIFVYDRQTDTLELVSQSSRGRPGEGLSSFPAISADGRYVAFDSDAPNLVRGDRNDTTDVFRHDRVTGETLRVSVTSDGHEAGISSHAPAISADGRWVVFHANSALVAADTNNNTDVYVRDAATGTTELISVALTGGAGNGTSFIQDLSADGRYVAFVSSATDLVAADANGATPDVYVRDRVAGTTELASVGSDGTQAEIGFFDIPAISADGRYVAFSTFTSLDPADTRPFSLDIYVHDRSTGTTELISVNSDEVPGDGRSEAPDVSADGRYVAFQSDSGNLVPEAGGLFPDEDIFVRDRQAGTTVRVSESSLGEEGNARSTGPAISGDGLVVAFASEASNLVPDDTNGVRDIFAHDDRPAADVALTLSDAPDPVAKGSPLTYELVVTNLGPATAVGVVVTDQLPAGVGLVSAAATAGSCTELDGRLTCLVGDLANGASVSVTIVVTPKKTGTLTNSAQAGSVSPDPNAANNVDTETTVVTR